MAAMFILPFFIAAVIAGLLANTWPRKMITFAAAVLIQFTLIFGFVSPGARSEMIGVGHRFRNQFQTTEVRSCAESILQKYQNGMLGTNSLPANVFLYPPFTEESIVVADSELPADLRGKFRCVGINTEYDRVRIIFEVEPQQGIIFGECSDPKGFFHFELGKDLYAYRYQRP